MQPRIHAEGTERTALEPAAWLSRQAVPHQRVGQTPGPVAAATPVTEDALGGNARVAEGVLAPPVAVVSPAAPATRELLHRPAALLVLELLALLGVGVALTVELRIAPLVTVVVLGLSLVTTFHAGRATLRTGLPHLSQVASNAAVPFSVVALGVALGNLSPLHLRQSALLILATSLTNAATTLVRRRVDLPARVVVVGDHEAIAKAATRWAGDRHAKVVGGLLLDGSADAQPVGSTHGVRTIRGIDEAVEWVDRWAADLVVVAPGAGVTSESVRRLGWMLERSDASLAVLGVLDSVEPHRIDATVLSGATLVHTRSSRPSTVVRALKWTVDRFLGAVLLVLSAPVLLALCVWIRCESAGPGLFTQTRVGRDGRPFRIYKLRTMRADAEQVKASLAGADEGHGVLFKVHDDPRVTRSGRLLRRTSVDELPQLINVVLGQMSLVGPRPNLPEEVAGYDETARRRLAVRPGMTGLWQVSGRSDLSWEESVELDVRYTDNYRLVDDLAIGLRTVGAVVAPRGAY